LGEAIIVRPPGRSGEQDQTGEEADGKRQGIKKCQIVRGFDA